ncbi:hypothetical protein EXD76_04580 [BEV proteobacterium]|nr:hypothetical protein [Candidatus Symbiopectobacterium sp. Chty_BC]
MWVTVVTSSNLFNKARQRWRLPFVGTTPAQAPESVIIRADKALYQAKSKGRNRAEIATE